MRQHLTMRTLERQCEVCFSHANAEQINIAEKKKKAQLLKIVRSAFFFFFFLFFNFQTQENTITAIHVKGSTKKEGEKKKQAGVV